MIVIISFDDIVIINFKMMNLRGNEKHDLKRAFLKDAYIQCSCSKLIMDVYVLETVYMY